MRRLLWMLAGVMATLAATELVLQILPTPSATRIGQYIDPRITTYPPGLEFRTATGWSLQNAHSQRANEYGFIPDAPFAASPDAVALIGDSLVEQSMLPSERRLASVLSQEWRGRSVYSMGVPGSSLFDYLERARFARDRLGARHVWIVVERADVRQSQCAGGVYTDACLDERGEIRTLRRPPREWLRDAFGHSALLQYMLGVLRLSPERVPQLFRAKRPTAGAVGATPGVEGDQSVTAKPLTSAEQRVIERFVAEFARMQGVSIGLVIDPVLLALGRDGEFASPALAGIAGEARRARVTVVHPLRPLQRMSAATRLDMRVGPYDAHWNALANCVVARTIVESPASAAGPLAAFESPACRLLVKRALAEE